MLTWEDICKSKFNIEKCKVLHIGSINIKVKYKLSNEEIKKVNLECDLEIGFHVTFKAIYYIEGKIIGWMVRNFISREANVLKL